MTLRAQADLAGPAEAGQYVHLAPPLMSQPALRMLVMVAAAAIIAGCRSEPPRTATPVVIWQPIHTWSGRGDSQTETFTSDSGGFRVHWDAKNETRAGEGRLRVVFRSGDSGREIIDAINARGIGHGIEEVSAQRPRWYYLTIESADVDWTVTVDERIDAVRDSP
jgi:hypothetical protein